MAAPRRRWWLYGLAAAGALVVALALGIAWLVTTPGGARLLFDRIANALGESTRITGVEGSLSGTLRISSIEVTRADIVIIIRDLVIERAPGPVRLGRAVFRRVEASLIDVRTRSSGAAARVPLTFEAPYPLRVESARVGELRVGTLAKDGKPPPPVVVKDIAVAGQGDARAWKVDKGEAQTPWGHVSVAGTLATTRPFALDVRGELAGEREGAAYRVAAQLGGTLQKIDAKVQARGKDLRLNAAARVEPFEKQQVRAVKVQGREVDIASFGAGLHTRLAIDADLAPVDDGFAGPVRVVNALPGAIDTERLPIDSAEGRIAWIRRGDIHELEVAGARLALPGGGSAEGQARWRRGHIEAKWTVANVDTAQLHTRLRSTRVGGTISAVSQGDAERFEVALSDPKFTLEGNATLAAKRLEIASVRVKHEGGAVEGKGFLTLADPRDFRFEGRAQHFDPSAFVGRAKGDLNFDFLAAGRLAPAFSGDVQLDIAQSRIGENPLTGSARVSGDAGRIASADVKLTIGDSHFQANGAFGRPGDAMQVAIQAPNVGAAARSFGIEVSGKLDAKATLTGTFAAPGGRFEIAASDLALPSGFHAASLNARGDVAAEANGRVDVSLEARTLSRRSRDTVQALAERATFAVQGTRASHRASLAAALAKDSELRVVAQGGLEPGAAKASWRGELTALALTGPFPFALQAATPLALAADRVELGAATLKGPWGEANLAVTRWTPDLLEARGSTSGMNVRNIARTLRLSTIPRGDLTVAAEWDLKAGETVDGFVSVSRVGGDLRIGDPPQPLGLEELKVRAESKRDRATLTASLRSASMGRFDGEASGTLQHVRAGFGLVPDVPITGRLEAQMDSLAWAAAEMGPEARAEGRVSARLALSGTFAEPRWNGRMVAEGVSLREPQSGFEIEKGVASLVLADRSLVVEKLEVSTPWHPSQAAIKAMEGYKRPASGTLSANGSIDLAARTGAVTIRANAVPVTQLQTRFLALSGEATLQARADGLLATGNLRADAGWIGALTRALPSVSDDVVVVRRSVPVEERRARERVRMDVRFSLGDHLSFTGRGLETRLAGDLRVQGELGASLRATGQIRTVAGTYDAYGRKLSIERGTLTFVGSVENPSLDVLALRKGLPVEAGVEVRGNVARPRVRLVSNPDVPESEKISWLVLGHGPGDVSQGEAATLASAANAILGRSSGAQQITNTLGVDDVRVGRSESTSALGVMPQATVAGRTGSGSGSDVVSVGKKLTKDIYVNYERGLADAEDSLRVTWQITRQFQMLVRAGYLPGVDAVYRWTFE
jgi:translocation and assembly module TamB